MGPDRPIVCTLESRRAEDMCSLIERHGATALSAPSMREIPIEDNPAAIRFVHDCIADRFPLIILLTGVGTDALLEVARSQGLGDELVAAMNRSTIVIRGPKPAAVLAKAGLRCDLKAPEPNTWRELLTALDAAGRHTDAVRFGLQGKAVAVQEYGLPNRRLYEELEARGAVVTAVPVYRWALPENPAPLENAIRQIAAGQVDVLLLTSANQVASVLTVAANLGLLEEFRAASRKMLIGSIGPTCSEALQDNAFAVHFEASPPKMGQLVRGAVEMWRTGRWNL